jgi:hypothetical protein
MLINANIDPHYRVWLNGKEVTSRCVAADVAPVPGKPYLGGVVLFDHQPRVAWHKRMPNEWIPTLVTHHRRGWVRWERNEGGPAGELRLET